ncbi:MAG: MnhB domain-containing protein [Acidimicrobiia bacterium]|nr:MnhB domain-containing protein [Acidimicrobiia bacterium]
MIASRSPVVRLGIRSATPLALMLGVYLLFAGHNNPGGGFSAGLVFGAVVTLRTVAGLQRPLHARQLVAGGMLLAALVALAPIMWGAELLDQIVVAGELPVLGTIKSGSALPFDIAVTAIVVGLVVALLDGLATVAATRAAGPVEGEPS